jgi:hypothetical protein
MNANKLNLIYFSSKLDEAKLISMHVLLVMHIYLKRKERERGQSKVFMFSLALCLDFKYN